MYHIMPVVTVNDSKFGCVCCGDSGTVVSGGLCFSENSHFDMRHCHAVMGGMSCNTYI